MSFHREYSFVFLSPRLSWAVTDVDTLTISLSRCHVKSIRRVLAEHLCTRPWPEVSAFGGNQQMITWLLIKMDKNRQAACESQPAQRSFPPFHL